MSCNGSFWLLRHFGFLYDGVDEELLGKLVDLRGGKISYEVVEL